MNLAEIFVLAVASAVYPTLLAVVIVILNRPQPRRLLTFFLAGAALVSLAIGLTAVFVLDTSSVHRAARHVSGPIYIVAGTLALLVGGVLYRQPHRPDPEQKQDKGPSLSQRALSRDSSRIAFVLGIVLDLPSIFYLVGLKDIALAGYTAVQKVLLVVCFNAIMFSLIEVPLIALAVSPELTQRRIQNFDGWLRSHGRRLASSVALCLGVYLVGRGVLTVT